MIVRIICGPPGAGKTHYVRENAIRGDLIIDFDALYQAFSGLSWYDKPLELHPFVAAAREAVLDMIPGKTTGNAWVIVSGARRAARTALRDRLNGEVIVLETPMLACLQNISGDERRKDALMDWIPLVQRWWLEYKPDSSDTRITA